MKKKILFTFESNQFEELSKNHKAYISLPENEVITLQEYVRRILAAQSNILK